LSRKEISKYCWSIKDEDYSWNLKDNLGFFISNDVQEFDKKFSVLKSKIK